MKRRKKEIPNGDAVRGKEAADEDEAERGARGGLEGLIGGGRNCNLVHEIR